MARNTIVLLTILHYKHSKQQNAAGIRMQTLVVAGFPNMEGMQNIRDTNHAIQENAIYNEVRKVLGETLFLGPVSLEIRNSRLGHGLCGSCQNPGYLLAEKKKMQLIGGIKKGVEHIKNAYIAC
jgi:hypothetical protein